MQSIVFGCVLISLAIIVQAELTPEQKEKIKTNGKQCAGDTGVDKELITAARQGKFTEDDKLKAFTLCMSKKIGFQNDAGEIQTEVVQQKLGNAIGNADVAKQLIGKCLSAKATPEQTAFESFKCYYETTPTHITADLTPQQKQKIKTDSIACIAQTGVKAAVLAAARQGEFAEDLALKSYAFCMSQRIGFQNAAGAFQRNVIIQKLGPALGNNKVLLNHLLRECVETKETPQETAASSVKCYLEHSPTRITVF